MHFCQLIFSPAILPSLTPQDLATAQYTFVHLLGEVAEGSKLAFLEWVCTEYNPWGEPGGGEEGTVEEDTEPGSSLIWCLDLHIVLGSDHFILQHENASCL